METMGKLTFLLIALTIVMSISPTTSQSSIQNFLNCISYSHTSDVIYTPNNISFSTILNMKIHNKRFMTATTPKPLAIITAKDSYHVQTTIKCAKTNNIQIRIRSGGHDYEGYSYVSDVPFVILDMFHLNSVDINLQDETAWVESGATIGKLYYTIAKKNNSLAFPSGVCFTLGAGGHFSGGGYGNLMRKFGLSVDNIIDAKIVDANGKILDRKSMGEDLFWAIRGGGGASFGVILSWKLKLVQVTPQVTVFNVKRNVSKGTTDLVYKWQLIAPKLHKDLFIRVQPSVVQTGQKGKKTVQVSFIGQFLGTIERLLPLMSESFPDLGLKKSDCFSMPWINSTLFWYGIPIGTPLEVLLLDEPKDPQPTYTKYKSDYVKKPIPKKAIESMWKLMIKSEKNFLIQWNPYGGRMEEISPSETPFPHRAGNLFLIQYLNIWIEESPGAIELHVNFSRSFYKFMTPYVSKSPREAFLNYRDADIGANHPSTVTKVGISRTYGHKFFKGNFERLVSVKTKVDPENFFRYEQSIPTKSYKSHM